MSQRRIRESSKYNRLISNFEDLSYKIGRFWASAFEFSD